MFYINNNIYLDKFNQLYDLDKVKKCIQNADTVANKLEPAPIKVTNHRLENSKKEKKL